MDLPLYSVRMRASEHGPHEHGGKHISGGELLTTYSELQEAVQHLLDKALHHSRGRPDFFHIQCDIVKEPVEFYEPLTVQTLDVCTREEGIGQAIRLLEEAGVSRACVKKALQQLPDESIRGAMLIDVHSGMRLDRRGDRGVRVSRMDWYPENFKKWANSSEMPATSRVKEALTLATKVCSHEDTIAELCWSDDPDYTTGYVASKKTGYQRISKLKEVGDERGCRIFFVDAKETEAYIGYLEKQPIFVQWGETDDTRMDRKK